jgi:hypothetical protein
MKYDKILEMQNPLIQTSASKISMSAKPKERVKESLENRADKPIAYPTEETLPVLDGSIPNSSENTLQTRHTPCNEIVINVTTKTRDPGFPLLTTNANSPEKDMESNRDTAWSTRQTTTSLDFKLKSPMRMPAWTSNHIFYILGAILTRDPIDEYIYMDVALAGKKMFQNASISYGIGGLDEDWALGKAKNLADPDEILAQGGNIYCQVNKQGHAYTRGTEVLLIPSRTTYDVNVNGLVHVLRCLVPFDILHDRVEVDVTFGVELTPKKDGAKKSYDGRFSIENTRTKKNTSPEEEFRVVVPSKSRMAGFFSYLPEASKLDPWQSKPDTLHLCIPGIISNFTCPLLDHTIEFVEYHLQQGVAHVHLGVDYAVGSDSWIAILRVLRTYIDEGKVSIMSTRLPKGPGWIGKNFPKLYHITGCLSYTKSLATWVGIWDIDEFLVPREPEKKTIVQSLNSLLEDSRTLPEHVCYVSLTSFGHIWPGTQHPVKNRTWVGQTFAHWRQTESDNMWQKSIVSNRNVYMGGLHVPGACRSVGGRNWNATITKEDRICARVDQLAMQHYRSKFMHNSCAKTPIVEDDEYAHQYFPQVLEGLRNRKIGDIVKKECGYYPVMTLDYVDGPSDDDKRAALMREKNGCDKHSK